MMLGRAFDELCGVRHHKIHCGALAVPDRPHLNPVSKGLLLDLMNLNFRKIAKSQFGRIDWKKVSASVRATKVSRLGHTDHVPPFIRRPYDARAPLVRPRDRE